MGLSLAYKKYQPKYFNVITGRPFKLKNINKYSQWWKEEYNDKKQIVYEEHADGFWKEYEYDEKGNNIYTKDSDGYWEIMEYDQQGNMIYEKDEFGAWVKWEYDEKNRLTYMEDDEGYWEKITYDKKLTHKKCSNDYWEEYIKDKQGNYIYYKNNSGVIIDHTEFRPKYYR